MTKKSYLTRQTLIQRARDPQDEAAWEEFISLYKNFIYHLLHKMNINANDFDDMVQLVLMKLWEGLKNYDSSRGKFRSWLGRLTKNAVINYLDKQMRQNHRKEEIRNTQELEFQIKNYQGGELEQLIEDEWQAYVTSIAFDNIKELFSGMAIEAFLLSQQGVTAVQIAVRLDLKKESVYVLVSRVKSKFIDEMRRLIRELESDGQ